MTDAFTIDCIAHAFNITPENCQNEHTVGLTEMLYGFHTNWNLAGEQVPREVYFADCSIETMAKTLFLETTTDMAVNHALPVYTFFKDGMCSHEKNREAAQRWPDRFLCYVCADPTQGVKSAVEDMRRQAAEIPDAVGLKLYPQAYDTTSYRVDDADLRPLFDAAVELGLKTVACHKAMPLGALPMNPYKVDDVDGAAHRYPELQWEIVHSGWAFNEETAHAIARYPNVWGNMEVSTMLLNGGPGVFEDMLAMFMFYGGAEKLLFTGGAMYIHPQGVLDKFRAFEFSDATLERWNPVPQITDEVKAAILGGNYARMIGLDVEAQRAKIADDEFERAKRVNGGLFAPWTSWKQDAAERGIGVPEPAAA